MTGLKLSLSWLTNRIRDGRAATLESVEEMQQQLDAGIASVRRISTELRPFMLDELGFDEAMAWQCSEFEKRSNLKVTLNAPAAKAVKDNLVATALFRIVQESLTNIARHANASCVKIDLTSDGETMVLSVCDDGQGFQGNPRQGGIGLVSMRERAISIGANFRVVSHPGTGTTVELTLACAAASADGEMA
jgi:signal transduction histidine kinase